MREITGIVVHCSATPQGMDIGATEIRKWHTDPEPKGRGWRDIGYHFVIRRDGTVEDGRPIDQMGAHCPGRNQDTVGICLVGGTDADNRNAGEANYTFAQYNALFDLVTSLRDQHNIAINRIEGHRDVPGVNKACPCFDVRAFFGIEA